MKETYFKKTPFKNTSNHPPIRTKFLTIPQKKEKIMNLQYDVATIYQKKM